MRRLRLPFSSSLFLMVILVSVLVLAQSGPAPANSQTNKEPVAKQQHGLSGDSRRMSEGTPLARHAGETGASASRSAKSQASGLNLAPAVSGTSLDVGSIFWEAVQYDSGGVVAT